MMLNDVYLEAKNAINAVQRKDYDALAKSYAAVYNYFVHHPGDLANIKYPYLLGTAFSYFARFRENDSDIAEVKLENALYLFGTCIFESSDEVEKTASAIRSFILLISQSQYAHKLFLKVRKKYQYLNVGNATDNPIIARAETMAYKDMVSAYLFTFSLEKDLHVYISSDDMQLFANCVNEFRKRQFNEEALRKGEKLFEIMYGILKDDISAFARMKMNM